MSPEEKVASKPSETPRESREPLDPLLGKELNGKFKILSMLATGGMGTIYRGEQIPLVGRICAICDVFDALLSARPYKDPWPLDDVLAEIERLRGTQFDPALVDAFLPLAPVLHREWFSPHDQRPKAA